MDCNTSQPSLRLNTAARSSRLHRPLVPMVCVLLLAGGAYLEHSFRQILIESNESERQRLLAQQAVDEAELARQCRLAFPTSQALQRACVERSQ